MTRKQARTRWCPFGQALDARMFSAAAVNRDPTGEQHFASACIAERCMAWREFLDAPASGRCGLAGDGEGAP